MVHDTHFPLIESRMRNKQNLLSRIILNLLLIFLNSQEIIVIQATYQPVIQSPIPVKIDGGMMPVTILYSFKMIEYKSDSLPFGLKQIPSGLQVMRTQLIARNIPWGHSRAKIFRFAYKIIRLQPPVKIFLVSESGIR